MLRGRHKLAVYVTVSPIHSGVLAFDVPVILAIDETDSLLQTDFYQDFCALVRSWHNLRASPIHFEQWEKLNLVLVIFTEPYLLIRDINQSPHGHACPWGLFWGVGAVLGGCDLFPLACYLIALFF